ncbi:MAG: hypothetical protein PHH58_09250 [Rhodoferax sp.]|nr:hypothetical protein [Rhodoferax sp.]
MSPADAALVVPYNAQVSDLTQHRLARALRQRVRYRYVKPRVSREDGGFRIQSPCCSRKVDAKGGMIDIALLVPHDASRWCLCSRDHASQTWIPRVQNEALDTVLDYLCRDSERQFWP